MSDAAPATVGETTPAEAPVSVFRKRIRRFRTLKRGYYSFLVLTIAYALSFLLPFIMNSKALIVSYQGEWYFPVFTFHPGKTFGQHNEFALYGEAETNYRLLDARFAAEGKGDWVLMPLVPYNPTESARFVQERALKKRYEKGDFSADAPTPPPGEQSGGDDAGDDEEYAGDDDEYAGDGDDDEYTGDDEPGEKILEIEDVDALVAATPPHPPSGDHWLGTDDRGRDLLCRLAYGFNVSMTFALLLTFVAYAVGMTLGSLLGYYGGKIDLFGLRVIEVWQTVPFLFTVMILGAALSDILTYRPDLPNILQPRFLLLVAIMAAFSWMGMTYYVRGEFLREKARDYVSAAISIGTRDPVIIFKHILPNSLTPVVTFAPFTIVNMIAALVALDYLGFGLPAPTPSWGELMQQALNQVREGSAWENWYLVVTPISALFFTLLLVVFVGEAVREAFDPKVYSRLR